MERNQSLPKMARQLAFLYRYPMRYRRQMASAQTLLLSSMLLALAIPIIIRVAIDLGIVGNNPLVLFASALAVAAVGFVNVGLSHLGKRVRYRVASKVVTDIRRDLFERILALGPGALKETTGGQALTRLTSDTTALRGVTNGGLFELLNQSLVAMATFAVSAALDWRLTLISAVPIVITAVLGLGVQYRLKPLFADVREHFTSLVSGVSESLASIQVLKAFGREDDRSRHLGEVNQRLADRRRQMRVAYSVQMSAVNVINALPIVLVLLIGARRVVAGDLTVGALVAVIALVMMIQMDVHMLTMATNALFQSSVTAERLLRVFEAPPAAPESADSAPAPRLSGRIEVADAEVRIGGRVLTGLTFEVRAGEFLAVTGPTGSGKTLLLNLLARLVDPVQGAVLYDGLDGRRLEVSSLRRQVIYVPQRPWLFPGTVGANIAFARPQASRDELAVAADRAGLKGMDLERPIGTGAANLSGGERQRVGLARGLLCDPAVLLLDNPTANLDAETADRLVETILSLRGQRTLVVATPDASLARLADHLLVLDGSRLVEKAGRSSGLQPAIRIAETSAEIPEAAGREVASRGS